MFRFDFFLRNFSSPSFMVILTISPSHSLGWPYSFLPRHDMIYLLNVVPDWY